MQVKNKTALITGAGSGIGQAISYSLAKRGCNLAVADIDLDGLEETEENARKYGIKVSSHVLDVTDRKAVNTLPRSVSKSHEAIDILINNAGITAGGTFSQLSEANFERVFDINFNGVVRMTRTFLPILQGREEARIVNISSLYGLVSPPEKTAYSASKFAVRGFSDALRHELEQSTVDVTVVMPGGVATKIAQNGKAPDGFTKEEIRERRKLQQQLLRMPPEKAGEIIVKGIEKDQKRILIGFDAKLISLISRLLPVNYWKLMKVLTKMRKSWLYLPWNQPRT